MTFSFQPALCLADKAGLQCVESWILSKIMDNALKLTSIRCDLHPPLSAIMFCDTCRTFLCRICAEVKPGGRVCSTCKKPCREPSVDEFQELLTARKRAKEDAILAAAAAARIKDQHDKAKQDRDARLKAEFAARKSALNGPKPPSNSSEQSPLTQSPTGAVPTPIPSSSGPSSSGGTMYDPGRKSKTIEVEKDPLAHLAERSYLNVIDKAQVIMLLVSIATVVFGLWIYFYSNDDAQIARHEADDAAVGWRQEKTRLRNRLPNKAERAAVDKEIEENGFLKDELKRIDENLRVARIVVAFYMGAAILLFILRHFSDTLPRESTVAAFVIFLILNLVDMAFFGTGNRFILLCRIGALIGLYKAMLVGIALHRMREEKKMAELMNMSE